MDRKTLASVLGLLSLASSLAFWVEVVVGSLLGFVPRWLDMGFDGWVAGWALGVLFAILAASFWPRRWWFAILVPVASFFAALTLISVSHVEW